MTDQPAPLVLGPAAIAGLEKAALRVMHARHPGRRFVIERDQPDTTSQRPTAAGDLNTGKHAA